MNISLKLKTLHSSTIGRTKIMGGVTVLIALVALTTLVSIAAINVNNVFEPLNKYSFFFEGGSGIYLFVALGYIVIPKNKASGQSSLAPSSNPSAQLGLVPSATIPDDEVIEIASKMYKEWQSHRVSSGGLPQSHYFEGERFYFSTGPQSMICQHDLQNFYKKTGQDKQHQNSLVITYEGGLQDRATGQAARLVSRLPKKTRLAIAHLEDMVNKDVQAHLTRGWSQEQFEIELRKHYKPDNFMIES